MWSTLDRPPGDGPGHARCPTSPSDDELPAPVRPLLRTRQTLEFSDAPLEPRLVDALVDVARWSGSANNRQPWRFVVVRDPDTIRRLAGSGLPHTVTLSTAQAAIAVVLPDDPERELVDAYDDGRVSERVLVAATLLGLGAAISWIRPDVLPVVRGILGLPEGLMVRTVLALGHPAPDPGRPRNVEHRGRLPRSETVHEDKWRG